MSKTLLAACCFRSAAASVVAPSGTCLPAASLFNPSVSVAVVIVVVEILVQVRHPVAPADVRDKPPERKTHCYL